MLEVLKKVNEPKDLKKLSVGELRQVSRRNKGSTFKKIKYSWWSFWSKLCSCRSNYCDAFCI